MKRLSAQRLVGLILAGLGLAVMAGWLAHAPIGAPELAMVFNTALCFVLLGAALLLEPPKPRWADNARAAIGGVVLVIAGGVFLEVLFDTDLGLDWPSLHAWLGDTNPRPGRVAPNTALGFIFAGIALLLMRRVTNRPRELAIAITTLLVILLGLTGLVGYSLQLELLYPGYAAARMAPLTAIGMVLLGVGLWSSWRKADWYIGNAYFQDDEKITLVGTALLVVVAVTTGVAGFAAQQSSLEQALSESLPDELESRANIIESEMARAIGRAEATARQARLVRLVDALYDSPGNTAIAELVEFAADAIDSGIAGLTILDGTNGELLRVGATSQRPEVEIELGKATPATLFWDDGVYLRSRVAVRGDAGIIGYLEVYELLPRIQEQLMKDEGLGQTGLTAVCIRGGASLLCFPDRHSTSVYEVSNKSRNGKLTAMGLAVLGRRGVFKGLDFRNHNVIAAYAPLTSTGLGIIVKKDSEEVLRPIRKQLQSSLPTLLLLVGAGAILLRMQVTPLAAKLLAERQRSRAVVESVADGIITLDDKGNIETLNDAAAEIFGYSAQELIGGTMDRLMPAEMRAAHNLGMLRYLAGGEARIIGRKNVQMPGLRKDGTTFPLELAVSAFSIEGRRSFVGIVRDVSARRQAEAALFGEKERLRVTLGSIGDGVITTDAEGRVTYLNAVAEAMTGWSTLEATGQPLPTVFSIVHERTNEVASNPALAVLEGRESSGEAELTVLVPRGGGRIPIENSAAPIRDRDGGLIGVVLVFHDVSQARQTAAEMSYQATHDDLTRLVNRREFERLLELAIETGAAEGRIHTVLFMDLDEFKAVNDTGGHLAGDELLRQLSRLMRDRLRKSDTLARLGGDEFVVLLEGCPSGPALRVAETLRAAVNGFVLSWMGRTYSVGVSIGLATFNSDGMTNEEVHRRADAACYAAKAQGRNRIQIYGEPEAPALL